MAHDLVALIETLPERDHLLFIDVAVALAFQGRGFGRALMSPAEEVARGRRQVSWLSKNEYSATFERIVVGGLFLETLALTRVTASMP